MTTELKTLTGTQPQWFIFDHVFVPWERVFYAGEWDHSDVLTSSYATHHCHSCTSARAGFVGCGGGRRHWRYMQMREAGKVKWRGRALEHLTRRGLVVA